MADLTVSRTILEQLGGRQFIFLTGSSNFIGDASNNRLTFKIGSGCKNRITHCRITLTPMDVYTVEFLRVWGRNCTTISTHDDIYAENLKDLFKRETGMYVTLHPRR